MATQLKVISTSDVPLEFLDELENELGPHYQVNTNSRIALCSIEPPSWVTFLADAPWWLQAFSAYAAMYIGSIVQEAGKDTWKNRAKALAAARKIATKIPTFASALKKHANKLKASTELRIGIPVPDQICSTELMLTSRDEIEIALELSLFVHFLPELMELLDQEGLTQGKASGIVWLRFRDDLSLEVSWFDKDTLEQIRKIIYFREAPEIDIK